MHTRKVISRKLFDAYLIRVVKPYMMTAEDTSIRSFFSNKNVFRIDSKKLIKKGCSN